jgi:hypothetical protein
LQFGDSNIKTFLGILLGVNLKKLKYGKNLTKLWNSQLFFRLIIFLLHANSIIHLENFGDNSMNTCQVGTF